MNNDKDYMNTNSSKEKSDYHPTEVGDIKADKSVQLQKIVNATAEGPKIERMSKSLITDIYVKINFYLGIRRKI
jgi:hypothetical protein